MNAPRRRRTIPLRVWVLGGRGFIGRHVVDALLARGHLVSVGSRFEHDDTLQVRMETRLTPESWADSLHEFDVVVNCVGILRERAAETWDAVHHKAVAALAEGCSRGGCRLIHVSALGLVEGSKDGFLTSKRAGEAAIKAIDPRRCDWRIVRPSLLDGEGGFGARWLRRVARWPLHVVPQSAIGRIAPLHVTELGEATARLCELPSPVATREIELGGERSVTLVELLAALRAKAGKVSAAHIVRLPNWICVAVATVCDALYWTPFSRGHLELLGRDNVPTSPHLRFVLGREPTPVGQVVRPIPSRLILLSHAAPRNNFRASGLPRRATP